eukprot:9705978-Ditylum_brightwellii.AAC.1
MITTSPEHRASYSCCAWLASRKVGSGAGKVGWMTPGWDGGEVFRPLEAFMPHGLLLGQGGQNVSVFPPGQF